MLTEEHKRAALQQNVFFWTNAVAEEVQRDTKTSPVLPDLIASNLCGDV